MQFASNISCYKVLVFGETTYSVPGKAYLTIGFNFHFSNLNEYDIFIEKTMFLKWIIDYGEFKV